MTKYRLRNGAIALALVGVAATLVALYVTNYRDDVEQGVQLTSVYVAARDIAEGTPGSRLASSDYLRREKVLHRSVVAGAIVRPAQLAALTADQQIFKGEQVTVRQFRPLAQQGVLAKIEGTTRAISLPGERDQLLAGTLKDGDHVDVVANIKYKLRPPATVAGGTQDRNRVATRVIVRDLVVLQAPAEAPEEGLGRDSSYSALLAVTDAQAQKLFFALKNGDWTLVLRPVDKPGDSPDTVETLESLLGDGLAFAGWVQLTNGYGKGTLNGH